MVHLSAYQPQFEPSAQYCTEIPKGGDTYLVVDLIDPALRDMPIGMRVIRGTSEAEDETVTYLRPSYHPDGVIKGETSLDQGLYTVIITAEGLPPLRYQYPLRVQMINYANIFRTAVGPLIGLLLLDPAGIQAHEIQARAALARLAPPVDNATKTDRTTPNTRGSTIHHFL